MDRYPDIGEYRRNRRLVGQPGREIAWDWRSRVTTAKSEREQVILPTRVQDMNRLDREGDHQ